MLTHIQYPIGTGPTNTLSHLQVIPEQPETHLREDVAVQELAFHKGVLDRDANRNLMPPSPFEAKYDHDWKLHWHRGRESQTRGAIDFPPPRSPSHPNFNWAPLINPHARGAEQPVAIYDPGWSRALCSSDLDGMESLIRKVMRRGKEWERLVCDVTADTRDALQYYPDLEERYEKLKYDAQAALAGRRPSGY